MSILICFVSNDIRSGNENGVFDTTINKVLILRNSNSVLNNIGDITSKLDKGKDFPDALFKSTTGTEVLKVVFFPGDPENCISMFEVAERKAYNKVHKLWPTRFKLFETESGVKLGISKEKLLKIKPGKYKESKIGDQTILLLSTDSVDDKLFLDKYNMVSYTVSYYFRSNRLVKFSFGFEYP